MREIVCGGSVREIVFGGSVCERLSVRGMCKYSTGDRDTRS